MAVDWLVDKGLMIKENLQWMAARQLVECDLRERLAGFIRQEMIRSETLER